MRTRMEVGHFKDDGRWEAAEKLTIDATDAHAAKEAAVTKGNNCPIWYGATHVRFWFGNDPTPYDLSYPDPPTPHWSR